MATISDQRMGNYNCGSGTVAVEISLKQTCM